MSQTYSTFVTALGELLVYPITDATSASPSSETSFNNILPRIIEYAEGRCYRECDFLATRQATETTTCTANNRQVTVPATTQIVQGANIITPAGTAAAAGTRNPVELISLDLLNSMWPVEQGGSLNTVPAYAAMLSDTTMILAPTPAGAYKVEIIGTFRPTPLSSSNTSTYLATNYGDMFLAAAMVFATGFQRDFGAQAEDPAASRSWEQVFQTAKKSAYEEDQRRKGQSTGWSPLSPAPLATPQRS